MDSILFTAYDIRGDTNTLTVETAWNVGKAVAEWLPESGAVAVFSDAQANGLLVHAICEGVTLQGRAVELRSGGRNEQLQAHIEGEKLAGGVFVSLDQLENVSTIELFDAGSDLVDSENGLKGIEQLVLSGNFVPSAEKGQLTELSQQV